MKHYRITIFRGVVCSIDLKKDEVGPSKVTENTIDFRVLVQMSSIQSSIESLFLKRFFSIQGLTVSEPAKPYKADNELSLTKEKIRQQRFQLQILLEEVK
ncbi:hypothetical protein KHA80_21690 [Anaerobacillus sp. HL2]|nr:hypothetical protein KHA80_21690 [Anaerobacillus sp. HL2]